MGNELHPLFDFHPASALGRLGGGSGIGAAAKEDAEPLPDEPRRLARSAALAERLVRRVRRVRPASA